MPVNVLKYIHNSETKNSQISLFNYKSMPRENESSAFEIFGFFSASSDVEIPGDQVLKFAWDGFVDGFEYSKTNSISESLKLGLGEAVSRAKQLIVNDKSIGEHGVNVNFTVFVFTEEGVYVSAFGDGDIFIYKQGKLINLLEMIKSKGAKTAAVVMDEDDLMFASSSGYLSNNMLKLISTKNKDEMITALEELGKEVKEDTGMVAFWKEIKAKNPYKKEAPLVSSINKRKKHKTHGDLSQEPPDTDYIPTSKISKKVFKPIAHEQDLKDFLYEVAKKLEPFKKHVSKGFFASVNFFGEIFEKIKKKGGKIIFGFRMKISSKFGRERWFKKVSAKISQSGLQKRRNRAFKGFKIDGYKDRTLRSKRFKQLALTSVVVCSLVFGVKFTIDQKDSRERRKMANLTFVKVEDLLNDAQSKLGTSREDVEMSVYQAAEELKKVPSDLGEEEKRKLDELQAQVLGIQDSLYKRVRLSLSNGSIEKFYSTYTYNTDSDPQDIAIFKNPSGATESLIVSDWGTKSILKISLYDNTKENIPDDNKLIDKPFRVYARPDSIFVFDLTNGILKSEYKNGSFQSFVKLSGLGIESIKAKDPVEFAMITFNENAYILDRGQRALLRSVNYEGGYSLISPYLEKDEYVVANDVFADNMSIYITAEVENGLFRYVNNNNKMVESPVKLTGLDTPIKNALCGHSRDSLDQNLFIFDAGEKRLLMFEKPMESGEKRHPNEMLLLRQYVYDKSDAWNKVKDIVADYDEKNAYILDDTTIWKVKL